MTRRFRFVLSRAATLLVVSCAMAPVALHASPVRRTVLFPGVASQPGKNQTQWRAEAVFTNPGDATLDILLELIPRGQAAVSVSLPMTLAAGETRRIPDLYAAIGAPSGAGTLRLTGDVLAWVRSFNQAASGTFGQDVPEVTADSAWSPNDVVLFHINTPADTTKDFRSNLLLTNLAATDTIFTLTSGTTARSYTVAAKSHQQITDVGNWMGLATGTSILSVSADAYWSGTVSRVDPASGDPTTVRGLIATSRSVSLFPAIASASGYNGTQWRAEAVLYNPRATAQNVTLEIIPRGGSVVAASTSIHMEPLEVRNLADVYAAVSAPSGYGMLRVTGDVLTWVRSFNQGQGMTFGQDVPEITPGVGFGPGASVAFPVSTPADTKLDFRSNLQVYNHESRQITLTVAVGSASKTFDVPALSYAQQSNVGAWLGLSPGLATTSVSGTGRWSGTVSTVDPYLGDPTTVVAVLTTPNPAATAEGDSTGAAATATIGAAGGKLVSDDGRLTLTVPAGALGTATVLTLQPLDNLAWSGEGPAYRLGPDGTTFSKPATLTFSVSDDDTQNVGLQGLGVASQDGDGFWHLFSGGTYDAGNKTVSVPISRLSAPDAPGAQLAAAAAQVAQAHGANLLPPKGPAVSLVDLITLMPRNAMVDTYEWVGFLVIPCFTWPSLSPAVKQILGSECRGGGIPVRSPAGKGGIRTGPWSVNGIQGGTFVLGTITDEGSNLGNAVYQAPIDAPEPPSVQVQVNLEAAEFLPPGISIPLSAHVSIGKPDYVGVFTILSELKTLGLTFKVEADPVEIWKESDGPIRGYGITGTATMKSTSFRLGTLPCRLLPPAGVEIKNLAKQPSYFQISHTDPKAPFQANWVLEPLHWDYVCAGAVNWPFDLAFGMEEGAACGNAAWVPTSDVFPAGTFAETCLGGITNTATWDFHLYRPKPHL